MMSKHYIHPATCFFLLTQLVVLLSWIGNIYGWEGVENLMSPEGLRWKLRTVGHSFLSAPLIGSIVLLFLGGGLLVHTGCADALWRFVYRRRELSRKERNALIVSIASGCILMGGWLFLAYGPWGGARSINGRLSGSPLLDGSVYLLSVLCGIMGGVYGYAVNFYHTDKDIVRGMSYGFIRIPEFFVIYFFVVQLFEALEYSKLYLYWGVSEQLVYFSYIVCILFSLGFALRKKNISL